MYKLHMDDKFVEITDFSETLDGMGNLTFNISNNQLELSKSSFTGLKNLKEAIADSNVVLKVTDDGDNIIWEDAGYTLDNASFSAGVNGVYFSAYFTQFSPAPVDGAMAASEVAEIEE